ncbi:hypothetical protein FUA48_01700 [Flavobacterium alkalisoli]|uniref:DUF748 domain-containing protein n=1 Tax=Flavobacterium alkalisoli TaxID=2602769 RepID=A0A5B9FM58_9FLAO|nr:hypothetical protein [Flavobacterium alkalisoli]QEE48333.1 hypothetical protein FUA48_01700 [Flavobacterium alkalisoli]
MSLLKKILIGTGVLILLLIIANYGISYWISQKLPSVLQSEEKMPYNISYRDLDIDLLRGNLTVLDAALSPKDTSGTPMKNGAFGKIDKIKIESFSLWQLLVNDKIKVQHIIIEKPEIILYPEENKYHVKGKLVKPFKNTISTETIDLTEGKFTLLDSTDKIKLQAYNIKINLKKIKVDSSTVKNNMPVKYSSYLFNCDSIYYQAGSQYHITTQKITLSDTSAIVNNFKLTPELSRIAFAKSIPKEKDQYRIAVEKIHVPNSVWGFVNDTLFVHSPEINLNKVNAVIYRPKMPTDDLSTKKLYSQMLRELNFDLQIDKINLKDSYLEYQEQQSYDREPAKVSFSNFNATVANIYSPLHKEEFPTTSLDVSCLFMKSSPLNVHWTFNIPDQSDSFTIKGHLQNVNSSTIDPVAKPLMNLTTQGDLEQIYFTFNGNRETSNGAFAIRYENLKVKLYKKDGKKENKLMSAVGNLLAKNDSDGDLKQADVSVDREKSKSVFNFLWRFLQEGLKKTLLPKIMTKKD